RLSKQRRAAGGIAAYSGADGANPVDVHAVRLNTTASTSVTAPSVTTTVAGALVVHLGAVNSEGTISPPTGMSERWEAAAPRAGSDRDATAAASDGIQLSAGATGTRSATTSQAGRSIAVTLALRPAPASPPAA
ncbi:MAG TPA: hypothetical protein VI854_07735, partial [Acidimicrobiia bacterium]|nr:hypothetical protein [Acidimicrobiia bacterium]